MICPQCGGMVAPPAKKFCSKRCGTAYRALKWYHANRGRYVLPMPSGCVGCGSPLDYRGRAKRWCSRDCWHRAWHRNNRDKKRALDKARDWGKEREARRERQWNRVESWDYRIMEQMAALVAHRAELGYLPGAAGVFWE